MNTVWSESIQGILTLDLSREIRFKDDRKELYLNLLGLKTGMTVADIGCGPGTLTRKLSKWLGEKSKIIGIDMDKNFIDYSRQKAAEQKLNNINYYEGDALNIPLKDNSVDACLSHTLIEHVPNKEFLIEQKRICRSKGRVSVMYARPDKYIKTLPDLLPVQTKRERELSDRLFKGTDEIDKKYSVGKYWPDPVALPRLFEEVGFKDVQVDAISVPVCIDDSRNSHEEKVAIVQAQMRQVFEGIDMGARLNPEGLSCQEMAELKQQVSDRFEKRLSLIKTGRNIWDYQILITQIVSGMVI